MTLLNFTFVVCVTVLVSDCFIVNPITISTIGNRGFSLSRGGSKLVLHLSSKTVPVNDNKFWDISRLKQELLNAGQAGILAYGMLNFLWYTVATAVFWSSNNLQPIQVQIKNSIWVTARISSIAFLKVLALVWTGSQVTKPFRIAGAVFLSPVVEIFMNKVSKRFNISHSRTFWIMAAGLLSTCFIFISGLISWSIFMQYKAKSAISLVQSFTCPFLTIEKAYSTISSVILSSSTKSVVMPDYESYRRNRYNEPIDPANQRHGWDCHPKICRGFWRIDKIIPADKLKSNAIVASITPDGTSKILTSEVYNQVASNNINDDITNINPNKRSLRPWLGREKIIYQKLLGIDHVILKDNGDLKIKSNGVIKKGWEFTPANRRILFELLMPTEGIALRWTSEMTRVPRVVTRSVGCIRIRPMTDTEWEDISIESISSTSTVIVNPISYSPFKKLMPSNNSRWPVIANFQMNKLLYGKHGSQRDQADRVKKGLLSVSDEVGDRERPFSNSNGETPSTENL